VFSRAVVATDLGPSSEGIVGCAGALRSLGIREAFLVYAIDLANGPSAEQSAVFARQAELLERDGIIVHVETPLGYAPHAITSLAIERNAGLIVMGTHGTGLFHTGFSGSVSSDVVRLSTVPVLLGPSAMSADAASGISACSRLLRSVLVPIDVEASWETICDVICGLDSKHTMRLELMHVVPLDHESVRDGREGHARQALDAFAARARAHEVNEISVTVARGRPEELVAEYAASGRYTLIALAPRCHDTIDQAFGSVTSNVIRSSRVPILLAPPRCDLELHGLGKT
jgi:nucleotide-binding universal stress UspA family protein